MQLTLWSNISLSGDDVDTGSFNRIEFKGMDRPLPQWYEFFAGGGMARLGLGEAWNCAFSNEWSEKKAESYRRRFDGQVLRVCDVASLTPADLPGIPALVWASFPCQDLSLAGSGAGLNGERSGTFKPFWELVRSLRRTDRLPPIVVLENVTGLLTSHEGKDFRFVVDALVKEGYRVGAMVIDAALFVPQSRPRLFIVAVRRDVYVPGSLLTAVPAGVWYTKSLCSAVRRLPQRLQSSWMWWNLPIPSGPVPALGDLIEDEPTGTNWHSKVQTEQLIGLMSPLHLEKIKSAQRNGQRIVGTVYKRMRPDDRGINQQRAEVRFDQVAGCLRTPVGGSSRQTIVVVEGRRVRSRLLSPREAARLMGVPEDYQLPRNYNEAYHLLGDGLAVPVVQWLNEHLLLPIVASDRAMVAA